MPEAETITLAYRYRLSLTPAQEDVVDASQDQLRQVWNHLVRTQRLVLRECAHGRKATITNRLLALALARENRGMAVKSARAKAAEWGCSEAEAMERLRREWVQKTAAIPLRKDGSRFLRLSNRILATRFADAHVNDIYYHYYALGSWIYNALRAKFAKSSEMWCKGKFRRPRFKRKGEPLALQKQVTASSKFTLKPCSDLSAFGGQALEKCAVIVHRPLPHGAETKQIAICGPRNRRYLVVMLKTARSEVAKPFPSTKRIAGIDPGIKIALTIAPADSSDYGRSDHQHIQPPLARDRRFLRRLARLQRKHDRQRRANNPDCFKADGTWIKGRRAKATSRNMRDTAGKITTMHDRMAEVRRDFYHKAACNVLSQFDQVAVGKWKPAQTRARKASTPAPKGLGAARRAINRISYDHAISTFIAILKDKAGRSVCDKHVEEVSEAHTTRTCPKCGAASGPSGTAGLSERTWTCGKCGLEVVRDAAAAYLIGRKLLAEAAPASQPAEPKGPAKSASARRKTQTKASSPVADEAVAARPAQAPVVLPQEPPAASGIVPDQPRGSVRAPSQAVTAVDGLPSCAGDTPSTVSDHATLADAAGAAYRSVT